MYLLGIDVGTTGIKAMVFDEKGSPMGYAFQECPISYPSPGKAEQDAEQIWEIAKLVIKKATQSCASRIGALSVSVQGDAVIAVDANRRAISCAYLGMDYRGSKEASDCTEKLGGKALFERTGMRPHPLNFIIKILWIKNNLPLLFQRADKFVTYSDFILGKLGSDEMIIDYTMAGRSMAFQQDTMDWDKELLNVLGIPVHKLSKPAPSGTVVGVISPALADELRLPPATRIVAGGHDQTCAALGAGITKENIALDSHGTAEVLSAVFHMPRLNQVMFDSFYPCYPYLIPGMYFTFALNHTGGALFKWYVENFCHKDQEDAGKSGHQVYDYIIDQFADRRPSPLLVLPHFNGSGTPTCDLRSKGAILGLTMATTRNDIAKAILESLCYEIRLNMDTMHRAGIEISQLRAVGGGARSPYCLQNKADILGIPVSSLQIREAACFGAALLAGWAVGIYGNISEAAGLVSLRQTYEPNSSIHRSYMEKYYTYAQIYDTIKKISYTL